MSRRPSLQIQKGTTVKFKFDDGSTLDWTMTEPCSVEHLLRGIDRWSHLNDHKPDPDFGPPSTPTTDGT